MPLDLGQLEQDCRNAVARRTPSSVVITDNRVSRHKDRTFLPAAMVELLHQVDTSGPDARDRVIATVAYCFDFMHGEPRARKGGQ